MDFRAATDQLTAGIGMTDVADRLGVSVDAVLRARSEDADSQRQPAGWEQTLAQLARERAEQLQQLAEALEVGAAEPVHGEAVPTQPFPYNVGTAT